MVMGKKKTTFNISKTDNFSEWYSEILNKAEVTDLRYGVKGFVVIRPWGARIIDKMYRIYESALRATGHDAAIFPAVIPEANFKRESSHVDGFAPEVFWLEAKKGEDRLALRPTSETSFYEMYSLWIRSYRDLPLKIYQRANIFRSETKATRPLIRSREFHWIETHDAFATKKDAEAQVQDDITMTEEVMHKIFGVPFLPMKRPQWDKFPGAVFTVGSDCIMPDGKVIQQPSTHLIEQKFVKAFDVKFVTDSPSYFQAPDSAVPNQILPELSSPIEKTRLRVADLPFVSLPLSPCFSVKLIVVSPSLRKTPTPLFPIQRFPLLSTKMLRT